MNLKFRILLTIVGCLLTISLLIGFSYAYIRHSTLSNNLINGNSKFIVPYNLTLSGGIYTSMNVNQANLSTTSIGNVVSSVTQSKTAGLMSNVSGTVTCRYELLLRSQYDYTPSGTGEYMISATITVSGTGGSGTTSFTPVQVPKLSALQEVSLGVFTISATGVGGRAIQIARFTYSFYNINADQTNLPSEIWTYLNYNALDCEVTS